MTSCGWTIQDSTPKEYLYLYELFLTSYCTSYSLWNLEREEGGRKEGVMDESSTESQRLHIKILLFTHPAPIQGCSLCGEKERAFEYSHKSPTLQQPLHLKRSPRRIEPSIYRLASSESGWGSLRHTVVVSIPYSSKYPPPVLRPVHCQCDRRAAAAAASV
jgi:hypothetical protein